MATQLPASRCQSTPANDFGAELSARYGCHQRSKGTFTEQFWRRVELRGPNECWPWIGTCHDRGYGRFLYGGRRLRANRVVWELANEQVFPEGKLACHSCDNPNCCNPAHIWPGTHAENVADMHRKGRGSVVRNRREAICRNGHPYATENILPSAARRGHNFCRTCRRAAKARHRARKRAGATA